LPLKGEEGAVNKRDPVGRVAMTLLGQNIPAVGPKFTNRERALRMALYYIKTVDDIIGPPCCGSSGYSVGFIKNKDGSGTLFFKGKEKTLDTRCCFDELLLKRFQKVYKKGIFILTCFFEDGDKLECLALTEGLGVVIYGPCLPG